MSRIAECTEHLRRRRGKRYVVQDRKKQKPAAARSPGAKPAKRKFRFGLAARVALIGCGAAIVATMAQWTITPLLARNEFKNGQVVYAAGAAQQLAMISADPLKQGDVQRLQGLVHMMAEPLPGGQAAIVRPDGSIIASTDQGGVIVASLRPELIRDGGGSVITRGDQRVGVFPIYQEGRAVGAAVIAMEPRTIWSVWLGVLWRNALVLVLALAVIAPFLLPLARKALSPVTNLEQKIRKRAAADKSKLADGVEDSLLTPLLQAVDEVNDRSDQATRRALHLAYADPVTRLPNRLRFLSRLEAVVDRGPKAGITCAWLVLADIDGFKKINQTLGPKLADEVLAQVGERLKASMAGLGQAQGFIGRVGPDLFGVIASNADQAAIKGFMSAAERAVQEPITVGADTLRVTCSFGAAAAPADARTAPDLLKQAELALKEAKRGQGPHRAFFDQSLLLKVRAQAQLEADLRAGLDRGEFVAVYQPKVKLETGELVGAEALARWRRPDGSVISPGVFVPMAEEMGLISKLGDVVMRDACRTAAGWNKSGIVSRIAVNVSPHQFNDPDFILKVQAALDESGLNPELLELEITESAAVADPDKVARIMWPLRNRGVRLAIDDFGTGHSNFSSITRLPFDVFKIDQQFIRALDTEANAPAIVEMILAMAEALGQETVAEGVETRSQAEFLLRRQCTIGQGYYFSPPLPAEEFDAFVRSWRPRPADRFAA
jgi:diguanylate cyclase (GGDEF)-like protein